MNLYHLRYFVTLAHLEHYTRAAELLAITQPSLSHAISSLEKELGVKLFEKDGRNVALTKCGQAFLADVEQSLGILDSSVNKLQLTGMGEGHVDIGMLRTLCYIAPKFVRDFLDSRPNNQIRFYFHTSAGMTPDIIQGLKKRQYDVAFCSLAENEPAVDFVPIARQELVLIVPQGHPLETRDSIGLRETLSYPQILYSKSSLIRPAIDRLFEECGGYPRSEYVLDDEQAIVGLVAAGFGIAIIPKMPLLVRMPVRIIEISEPNWERTFYMATLKNVYQAPVVRNFRNFVMEQTRP